MVEYPREFPITEIRNVVSAVRSGTVKDNLSDFAHDLWVLQGYAQYSIIGEGGPTLSIQSAPEDVCAVEELEKLADSEGSISAQSAIPWELILQWALKKLLEELSS